jgi:hypothetical protein
MSRTVTTQAELDSALAEGAAIIYIQSPEGVWITLRDSGSSHVVAWGSSHVVAWGSSHVEARDSSHVEARDSSHVVAWGSSHVEAWGSSHVEAWDSSHVEARGSSHVEAWDSSHVEAWDSSHVEARGSSHVEARPLVAVHLHSAVATVEGGVVIDVASIDQRDPQTWCDMQGIDVQDGYAVVYKAVNDNLESGRGLAYPLGKKVTVGAKGWKADGDCGNGLHFGPTPRHARAYFETATRFLACRVPVEHASGIPGSTAKIKARECVVLHEVDIDGKPLTVEAVA